MGVLLVVSCLTGAIATLGVVAQAVGLANLLRLGAPHGGHGPLGGSILLASGGFALSAMSAGLGPVLATAVANRTGGILARRATANRTNPELASGTDGATTELLLTRGVDATAAYLATYLPAAVLSAAAPLILLCWLASTDVVSGVVVASTIVVLPIFMVLLGKAAAAEMDATWSSMGRLARHFADVVRGLRTLRLYDRDGAQVAVLSEAADELARVSMRTITVALWSSFALELLASIATALVAVGLGIRLANGSVTLATALAVLLVTPEVYLPLRRAAAKFHDGGDGVAAMASLCDAAEARPSTGVELTTNPTGVRLELHGVGRTASDGAVICAPVHADVAAGATVWVTGPSGVGKSTLFAILLGLEVPTVGSVTVDGVPGRDLDGAAWRRGVAWLPQHPTFPGDSVLDAITLRAPHTDRGVVERLLRALLLDHLVERPGFFEFHPNDLTAVTSTGERRRLALARALLGPRRLTLLDEPLAHLDDEARGAVVAVLATWLPPSTTLVASHHDLAGLTIDDSVVLGGVR